MLKQKFFCLAMALFAITLTWGCTATGSAPQTSARKDALYTCSCGETCKCNAMSTRQGSCACGKAMTWHHVVRIEGDEALLCTCGGGCNCKIDPKNATVCSCGKPLKRVSLKGTGIHFCNCGGSCSCNTVSDQPGRCRCGMELKTSS